MIYLVEDDTGIRELVEYTLNSHNLPAKGFARPSEFWYAMEEQLPQLVILDIMLPEEDGLHILKRLRSSSLTRRMPVMMLTAKDSEYAKVVGLDSGADDYIPKPFGMMELIARVRALLRRSEDEQAKEEYTMGDITVSPSRHTVRAGKELINLTLKEFDLLCLLLEHQGLVLTRSQILNEVWGYSFDGESRTVDVHIRTLRQKLGPSGGFIQTVRGVGYKAEAEA